MLNTTAHLLGNWNESDKVASRVSVPASIHVWRDERGHGLQSSSDTSGILTLLYSSNESSPSLLPMPGPGGSPGERSGRLALPTLLYLSTAKLQVTCPLLYSTVDAINHHKMLHIFA